MAAFRTGWPTYNYAASECAAAPPLYYVAPCFYDAGVGNQIRKFLLDRSVFDLVDVNKFLHLTDPRLLGWYLSLSVEDRTDIEDQGGLQQFLLRHPALEVSQHYVYVKCEAVQMNVSSAQQTVMSNRSITQRATYFRSDCERLPNNMWVTLNRLRYRGDESQRHPTAFNCSTAQEPNQQPGGTAFCHLSEQRPSWQTSGEGPAAPPSFSVEPHRQGGQPELRSCTATPKGDKCDSTYADVSLSRSECPTGDEDVPPEYYSFNSTQMDATEYSEWSLCQPVEPEQNSSPLDPVEESSTAEGLQGHMLRGNESPEGDGEAGASFGDQSNSSIVVNDESILVCLTTKDVRTFQNRVHTESGAPKPDQSVTTADAAEHHSPPGRRVTTCDIMVGAEPATCASAVGKTEDLPTADKHVNTEVYMSDLDYVAEEFTKLQKVQEQLQGQKKEMKSSGCKWTKECDCLQRAQRAELGLLALQYVMCKQHCWRLHYTSSEGGQLAPMKNTNPSADFANLLQKLESDYNQMRDEIMAGTPLEELKPLCVDLKQVKSHASYNPAKIVREVQGNIPSRSSEEPRKPKTSAGEKGRPNDRSTGSSQRKGKENPIKSENSAAGRALADAPLNASKPGEKLTAACRELGPCEAWFDAEENPVEAQPGQEPTGVLGEQTSTKSAGEESELLCVSNLPSDATESDVMLWFEKHNASEASVSAFNTDFRVAIVMVSGPQSAEAAVRELHGCCVQGNTLRVEHIRRAVGGRRASASISGPQSSKDSTAPETSKTERKLMSHPPLGGSVGDGKVVVPPTAKGTSAPRHFDPMGSFHTLMAELTQRHPDAGRQGIVDALMELKAEQQGALSGLPLSTIREMTSELLTRSERAAKP
uniref:RNA-binding protein 44 isoform X1 n=2 Tax=Gasterosteus aculeatus aculeatus TaxID=481459 RepID=UPI001A98C6A9|nr:RNA-binding protein 44 isoform X1 [Gasterosteus aculeatus aculeatus]